MPLQHPITAVLEAQGRSARWLAGKTGVSPATITRITAGERAASVDFQKRAAEALGVPVTMLFPNAAPASEPA